ncbi:hypothetical protein MBAV_004613 [Candidatus Magnetobacterium bavaricum]|uniref:FG-GAP repeat-containing protein n=1 Tax=Candidatus Magnetobacterium bavaricum TaxID=29290 RepID=A0A0F3GMN1_9BACT|nr:hypothetical protein MBAV_004613 [Candidatus Magnetobacterium bavaricum]
MDGAKISKGDFVVKGMPKDWEFRDIGDFNGDGKTDVLWQDTATGDVYVWLMDGVKINGGDFATRGLPGDWQVK